MTEPQARQIASVLGGWPWQPYPGLWLVLITRPDDKVVLIDADRISVFGDLQALEDAEPDVEIRLD